ncbi:hypothetical protein PCE1_002191 [Barthelona sp. PCE]
MTFTHSEFDSLLEHIAKKNLLLQPVLVPRLFDFTEVPCTTETEREDLDEFISGQDTATCECCGTTGTPAEEIFLIPGFEPSLSDRTLRITSLRWYCEKCVRFLSIGFIINLITDPSSEEDINHFLTVNNLPIDEPWFISELADAAFALQMMLDSVSVKQWNVVYPEEEEDMSDLDSDVEEEPIIPKSVKSGLALLQYFNKV